MASCEGFCQYRERCAKEQARDLAESLGGAGGSSDDAASCPLACASDFGARPDLIQQRVLQALGDCYRELRCDSSDDACSGQVLAELELDAATPLVGQCLEVQDDCGTFSDDLCTFAVIATPPGRARLGECLSAGCDVMPECIEALRR